MAFAAKVKIEGKEYDALKCGIKMLRDVDQKGRPSSQIYGVKIWATVESTEDTAILEAMLNQYKPFKGSLIYKKGNEDAKMKEVEFEDSYVIEYDEGFVREDKTPMVISFVLTAKVVKCGSAVHEEEWPE